MGLETDISSFLHLLILANIKDDTYNLIPVIIDWLIKIVYYELIKAMIDKPDLAKMIINMVIYYHGVCESILMDQGLLFTSKFWFLLY